MDMSRRAEEEGLEKTQQSEMPPEPMLIDKELKRPQKPSPPQSKKIKKTAEV